MECNNCPYWYAEDGEHRMCQFRDPDDWAPCAQSEVYTPDDYYESEE